MAIIICQEYAPFELRKRRLNGPHLFHWNASAMTISRGPGPDEDTTIFKVRGNAQASEVTSQIVDFLVNAPTRFVIWDFREGTLGSMGANDLRKIIHDAGPYTESRAGGRTAIVCKTDLDFGLSRMFEAFAALRNIPFEIKVFRDLESARHWLHEPV